MPKFEKFPRFSKIGRDFALMDANREISLDMDGEEW